MKAQGGLKLRVGRAVGATTPATQTFTAARGEEAPKFGLWKRARITDASRPYGKQFSVGEAVFYRDGETIRGIPTVHLFRFGGPMGGGIRRWLSETQLNGGTSEHEADVGNAQQERISAAWAALEPKHAGYHPGGKRPKRFKGFDTRPAAVNPEVRGPGWQGDTVFAPGVPPFHVIIYETAFWDTPPVKPPSEEDAAQFVDLLEHEQVELVIKGDLVDQQDPYISDVDRSRRMDEMEGIAHVLTIGQVEGYYGPDAEKRYLEDLDYKIARERGFGKLVDSWEKTDL